MYYDSVEKDEFMVGLFLDLSKTFETIVHDILIRKLFCYSIRELAIVWVSDYLSNRKQYVSYDNSNSTLFVSCMGVPPEPYAVSIYNKVIQFVEQYEFIGVCILESWKTHMEYISTKISKGIGILVRARTLLFRESLLTLYNSLIKPYLTYCLHSWGSTPG